MDELKISITEQGKITTNLEALKSELSEVAERYKGLVVQETDIAPAKKDLAELRKLRSDIEDRCKAVKKEWNKPYEEFEKEVKSALAIIDEPIGDIDGQIKGFEKAEKEAKRAEIEKIYAENVSDEYKPYMPLEKAFNEKWLNKSVKEQEIKADLSEKAAQIMADLDAIKALDSEIEDECLKAYKDAGLAAAIKRNGDYLSAKQLAEQKAKEDARKEAEGKPLPTEEFEMPLPTDFEVVDDTFRFEVVGLENIDKVKQFLEFSEIKYREI